MPVTVMLTSAEAEALTTVPEVSLFGNSMSYDPSLTATIINQIAPGEVREKISQRLATVATQLGIPQVMFKSNETTEVAPEPVSAKTAEQAPEDPPTSVPEK